MLDARNPAKDHAESAAQQIRRLAGRKVNRLPRDERKSQGVEPELQAASAVLLFLFGLLGVFREHGVTGGREIKRFQ